MTTSTAEFRPGMVVKFIEPMNDGEAKDRMEVLELRGPRLLVRSLVYSVGETIRPTAVYLASDLIGE